jgi:hypothetical protein
MICAEKTGYLPDTQGFPSAIHISSLPLTAVPRRYYDPYSADYTEV